MYVPDVLGGQMMMWNPLEQELQMVVIHHVGAGTNTCPLQDQQAVLNSEPSPQPQLPV